MARLEASRLAAEGDLAGAWRLHRANLRSKRHAGMHGGMMQRHVGQTILSHDGIEAVDRVSAASGPG